MDAIAIYIVADLENYKTTEITINISVFDEPSPEPEPGASDSDGTAGESDGTVAVAVGIMSGIVVTSTIGGIAFWIVCRKKKM